MIHKIRSLFRKAPDTIEVTRSDLPSFIEERLQDAGLGTFTKRLEEGLHKNADLLDERAETLGKAVLKNDNIPSRAKTIMQGNRQQYIVKTREFADRLREYAKTFASSSDPGQVEKDLDTLREEIEGFSKNTHKQYQILQEFFAHESYRIAEVIRETDQLKERTAREIRESEFSALHRVSLLLEDIRELSEKKEDLKEQLQERQSALEKERNEEKRLEAQRQEILDSEEYSRYESLQQTVKNEQQRTDALREEIGRPFMTMSRALRKFSKVSVNESLVKGLLDDPARTLTRETPDDIAETLSRLKESVPTLGLKDNVVKKTVDQVDSISREWLTRKKEEFTSASRSLDEARRALDESSVPEDLKTLDGKIHNAKRRQKEIADEMKEMKKQLESSGEEEIYARIRDLLSRHNIILDPCKEAPSASEG